MSSGIEPQSFYDSEHAAFRDSVSRFLEQSLATGAAPTLGAAAEQDLLSIGVPEQFGGAGVSDLRFTMVMVEEAMRVGAVGTAVLLALPAMVVVPALTGDGGWTERTEILAGIAAGSVCVGVAGAHQPLAATRDGDAVIVDGSAAAVLNAAIATHFLVSCRTDGSDELLVLVDAADPAVRIAETGRWLGAREAGAAHVTFQDVHVPGGRIVKHEGLSAAGDLELFLAAIATAGSGAAISWTSDYAAQRQVFGRELKQFENTRHVMSRLGADLIVTQFSLRDALALRHRGPLPGALTAALAIVATGLYVEAADEGLQLHGGYGYMHEYPIAQAFADAGFFALLMEQYDVTSRCGETTVPTL
jgi:acyl-CoA dehydrogenase